MEVQRFARLVGNVDGDEARLTFKGRVKDNCSWRRQGDGITLNDLAKLKSAAEDAPGTFVGMHGTILKDVFKYLNEFDANGNGKINSDEFVIMLPK